MIPQRIKIKFSGPPYMAIACDAETDEEIPNIQRVDLVTIDVQNQVYEARLVVLAHEIEGEIPVSASQPARLSDAEFDEIVRRLEQRLIQTARARAAVKGWSTQ